MSPDAVTIHDLQGDPNPYAYVRGTPLMGVDPDGNYAIIDYKTSYWTDPRFSLESIAQHVARGALGDYFGLDYKVRHR